MGLVQAIIVCAVLGLATGHSFGSRSSDDVWLIKAPGGTALFNTFRDAAPFTFISWKISNIPIITTSNESDNFTNPEYADRITLFSDGSLELRDLTLDDGGIYTVNITLAEGPQINKTFTLRASEPASNVRVTALPTDLIENQSSVKLTCVTASGTDLRYSWYNRTHNLPFNKPVITLTNVSRYDGPFSCKAYNLVSSIRSDEFSLSVSYGPDVKDVKAVPLNDIYFEGSKLTLSCIADSRPEAAEITWSFNSDPHPVSGAELVLDPLTTEQSGLYSCEAFNNKTMIYKSSPPLNISVEKRGVRPNMAPVAGFVEESLSDGAIAGISIACIMVALGSAGALAYAVKKNK